MSLTGLRIILFIVLTTALVRWPVPSFFAAFGLVIWLAPRVYRDHKELTHLRASEKTTQVRIALAEERASLADAQAREAQDRGGASSARVAELEMALSKAKRQIADLKRDVAQAKATPASADERGDPLFRRVGLDQDCPKWVAVTVRREYRKRLHSDGKPPHQKMEAERRFKEAESVFDRIWAERGF
jgi:chromosome segregation ATPase